MGAGARRGAARRATRFVERFARAARAGFALRAVFFFAIFFFDIFLLRVFRAFAADFFAAFRRFLAIAILQVSGRRILVLVVSGAAKKLIS